MYGILKTSRLTTRENMPNPLNYDAGIPVAGAFKVQVPMESDGKAKLPGSRFLDFKPNPNANVSDVAPSDHVKKKTFMRAPVARFEKDFIGPEESASRRQSEKERIVQLAKDLWEGEKDKRIAWKNAQDLVAKNPESEASDVLRAKKLLEKTTAPMSKQEVAERAHKQFYGMRS